MNLKTLEKYLRVNLLGPDPRLLKKRIYRAAVSQRLRNTDVDGLQMWSVAAKALNKQQYSRQKSVLQREVLQQASYKNLLSALESLFLLLTKYYNRG
jgi:hypothetical protein